MSTTNYLLIKNYLENLATNHHAISKFSGFSKLEMHNILGKLKGEKYPMMVLFEYQGKLSGPTQRTFATRTVGFSIFTGGIGLQDYTKQYQAIGQAEEHGLEILARINYDSKTQDGVEWLYKNFDKSEVRFEELRLSNEAGVYGMEFYFDLKVPQPFGIKTSDWNDISQVC